MDAQRVWFAAIGTAIIFAGSNMWTKHSAARQIQVIARPSASTTSVIDSAARTVPAQGDDWAEPRVDLNGNEIDAAVSDYRVDRRGEMYERHAPDTALLRLSAPQL